MLKKILVVIGGCLVLLILSVSWFFWQTRQIDFDPAEWRAASSSNNNLRSRMTNDLLPRLKGLTIYQVRELLGEERPRDKFLDEECSINYYEYDAGKPDHVLTSFICLKIENGVVVKAWIDRA